MSEDNLDPDEYLEEPKKTRQRTTRNHSNDYGDTKESTVVIEEEDRTVILTEDETIVIDKPETVDIITEKSSKKGLCEECGERLKLQPSVWLC